MQLTLMPTSSRLIVADFAEMGIGARWAEHMPGWCERWRKQVLRHANVPEQLRAENSGSAREGFEQYQELGLVLPVGTVAQIGDIVYWVRDGDGVFGHVAIKYTAYRYAENSSVHWSVGHPDARGWRLLAGHPGYRVVRIWENAKNPR